MTGREAWPTQHRPSTDPAATCQHLKHSTGNCLIFKNLASPSHPHGPFSLLFHAPGLGPSTQRHGWISCVHLGHSSPPSFGGRKGRCSFLVPRTLIKKDVWLRVTQVFDLTLKRNECFTLGLTSFPGGILLPLRQDSLQFPAPQTCIDPCHSHLVFGGRGEKKRGLRKARPLGHEEAEHLSLLKLGQHPFPTHFPFL